MNFFSSLVQFLFVDLLGSVLYFPIWWYTEGFFEVVKWAKKSLQYRWRAYSFSVWFRNFFVPMYGQYDLAGRVVSVFMRLVVLIGRAIAFVVEALLYVAALGAWLALPALSFLFFFLNFFTGIVNVL
jgi:hypothetical protein